jgi:hypothetical protein
MFFRKLAPIAPIFLLAACSSDAGSTGSLTFEDAETVATGTFVSTEGVEVSFSSQLVDTHVLDIVIEMNGMLITALVDVEHGVIEYDGFAADNGEDTQILDEDRATLLSFARALDELGPGLALPLTRLRGFVSTWAEFPTSLDTQGIAFMEEDRSIASICWAVNSYQQASHDDWDHDWWDDASTVDYAYVSMHGPGSCSDGTYFWTGSSWSCYEPDHSTSVEYAYGNCLGRCGAGCGSDTQFTWDCLDHDECVRFGHDTASLWCDDQFTSTVDDWASAPDC